MSKYLYLVLIIFFHDLYQFQLMLIKFLIYFLCFSGQEHPHVLDKHIPEEFWQHTNNENAPKNNENDHEKQYKCPLKCSSSFSDKTELLSHFKAVHGFTNEIIQKVIKAHPQLSALKIEA